MAESQHLIYVAMLEEARVMASQLNLPPAPKSVWAHSEAFASENNRVVLITGGQDGFQNKRLSRIGKASAAQMTALGLARFAPRWIWNVGTCGGIADFGAQIGDVYSGDVQQHDMRVPLPIFENYARRIFKTYKPQWPVPVKHGRISTGDSFDKSEVEWTYIRHTQAAVVDMEAFAVADVVHHMWPKENSAVLPLIVLKGVTDVVSLQAVGENAIHQAASDFSKNLKQTMSRVAEVLAKTLQRPEFWS